MIFLKKSVSLVAIMMIFATQLLAWGNNKEDYSLTKRRDFLRDAKTSARPIAKTFIVKRYTQRKKDLERGILPGEHFTFPIKPGPNLGSRMAQKRYGLEKTPKWVGIFRVDKGVPVKKNKVIGGMAGYGEGTSTKKISLTNLLKIQKVK